VDDDPVTLRILELGAKIAELSGERVRPDGRCNSVQHRMLESSVVNITT